MNQYEQNAYYEMVQWQERMLKRPSMIQRFSKKTQQNLNELVPDKVHDVVTESIKKMVDTILNGTEYVTKEEPLRVGSLQEKEDHLQKQLTSYKKTAALEGAGTGIGGILLGMADFPLLLSIKMKFLTDAATSYGFNPRKYEERVFMLLIFQLAFSSEEHRKGIMKKIANWESEKERLKDIDWHAFQQEYRDYIDLAKLFQLLPGVGAAVGAIANYRLLDHLGEVAMNVYRMRILT